MRWIPEKYADAGRRAARSAGRLLGLACLVPTLTQAASLALPGDMGFRHDLQFLSDSGLTGVPLSTWPISLPDVSKALMPVDAETIADPGVRSTLIRAQERLRREMRLGLTAPEVSFGLNSDPTLLRGFEATPREEAELGYSVDYLGQRLAGHLSATVVSSAEDDKTFRLDDSYLSWALGNWSLTAGVQSRWWGPGWDGSLIWSNNARPIPGITFERNYSTPFQTPWLSWLGPWKFTSFIGQLEEDRAVSDARFLGLRFDFRPTDKLEIGISRTAQWGGDGRPEDFDTFLKLLAGIDNRGNDLAVADEPGNQLGGFDFRWRSPLFGNWPYAIYGQAIGEDEAGGLPSRYIGLFGIEIWGSSARLDGTWRVFAEAADTATGGFYGDALYNYAYEHAIYQSGYRYYGHSIGHTLDSDGRLFTLGFLLNRNNGRLWSMVARVGELNRDGGNARASARSLFSGNSTDYWGLELGNAFELFGGWVVWGVSYEAVDGVGAGDDVSVHARWSYVF